jgi:hypothetical protein
VFFGSPKIEAIIGHRRSPVVGGSARPLKRATCLSVVSAKCRY